MRIKYAAQLITLIVFTAAGLGACTSSQFLKVHYQLPAEAPSLEGITANVSYKDMRRNKALLSKAAREDMSAFSETFTLVAGPADSEGKLLGAYDLESLVKEIFSQRLQHAGVEVVGKKDSSVHLEIALKTFRLDLISRKWIFNMGYELNLYKNAKLVASESISGNAERVKTLGSRDADKVISELVTDMVNRLDVAAFLRQAGL